MRGGEGNSTLPREWIDKWTKGIKHIFNGHKKERKRKKDVRTKRY